MTDYGRGTGSESWYSDDPLYGDRPGWQGEHGTAAPHQAQGQQDPAQDSWDTYGGQQQYYPQPGGAPDAGAPGHYYPEDPYGQQYQGQFDASAQQAGYPATQQFPAASGHPPQTPQDHGPEPFQQAPHQVQQPGPYDGLPGAHGDGRGGYDGYDSYDGYAAGHGSGPGPDSGPGSGPGQGGGYAPGRDGGQGSPGDRHRAGEGPDPETGWDPGPDQGERDFFSRRDDEDDRDDGRDGGGTTGRAGRRGGRPRKRRAGCGCLALAAVLVGGIGTVGYFGYQEYQERFGPAPDYEGRGTGEIQIEIAQGSSAADIAAVLYENGVVRSAEAFVDVALANEEAASGIQPGVYTLRERMSAEAALEMLTDPASRNNLTIPEGWRATQVYAAIDQRLGLDEGTTEQVAEEADLGLPDWAEGDPEGFLFPSTYPVGQETTPEDVLRDMIDHAEAEFEEIDLESAAAEAGMTPREALVTASLVQAEAQEDEDFGKVSRVIANRLEIDMRLQFDSTVNYALGRSTLDVSIEDTQIDSPYNTYVEYGLPPGPICNPGHQALEAALNPTPGDWLYFVTVSEGDTRFTADPEEHEQNVQDFNEAQRNRSEQEGNG